MQIIGDALRRLGHQEWFVQAIRTMAPVDKRLYQLTGGRLRLAIGQQQLLLTTIGRKSGLARTVPLLYARDGADYVVVASNMGQEKHPAWSFNLKANPEATVNDRGRQVPVRARLADDDERARVWPKVVATYPAYDTYAARASHREIQVFLLTPHDERTEAPAGSVESPSSDQPNR